MGTGMQVRLTPQLTRFLDEVAAQGALSQEHVQAWKKEGSAEWAALRAAHAEAGPDVPSLRALCEGGGLVLAPRPRSRSQQTPEFRALMAELARRRDQAAYDAMLADTGAGEDGERGTATQYRRALAVGTHVVVTMVAFYAFGHVAGARLARGAAGPALGGAIGMTLALMLEVWLFVIRTSAQPKHARTAAARALRERLERQVQRQRREEPGGAIDRTGDEPEAGTEGPELSRQEKKEQ